MEGLKHPILRAAKAGRAPTSTGKSARAGSRQSRGARFLGWQRWIPAFAGMTIVRVRAGYTSFPRKRESTSPTCDPLGATLTRPCVVRSPPTRRRRRRGHGGSSRSGQLADNLSLFGLQLRARPSVRFAQIARLLLLLASDLCQFAFKTRAICNIQESHFPLFSSTS